MGTVYLIHFDKKLSHAQHYLGYTGGDLEVRLERHRAGSSARLMQVIKEKGIGWRLVRTWAGGRKLERKLKRRKNSPKLCPLCRTERGLKP